VVGGTYAAGGGEAQQAKNNTIVINIPFITVMHSLGS
jgi:hypothetical protein